MEIVAMMLDANFWRDRRVVITGHTGFKGAWLSLWLQHWGAQLFGYALAPDGESLFDATDAAKHMRSEIADIVDYANWQRFLSEVQPEIIFHFAAQSLVNVGYVQPRETFLSNAQGTVNVLEAARHIPSVRAIVIVTTDKIYANDERGQAFVEQDALGSHDPYSSSKACAELITDCYRRSFFSGNASCAIATARAGNVIGGGDFTVGRLLPDAMRAIQNQQVLTLRCPHAVRPWQHVLNALHGYLQLAQALCQSPSSVARAWNFGPDDADMCTVSAFLDLVSALSGQTLKTEFLSESYAESQVLRLNSLQAREQLRWQARWDLGDGVQHSINWYHAYYLHKNMREFSLKQIEQYLQA